MIQTRPFAQNQYADLAQRCVGLKSLSGLPNAATVIATASLNPAGRPVVGAAGALPEHCEVFGALNERTGVDGQRYAIKFHLRLPTAWNGRFYFQGGGGTNGVVGAAIGLPMDLQRTDVLGRGYAVVSQDAGHDNGVNNDPSRGGTASFGLDLKHASTWDTARI